MKVLVTGKGGVAGSWLVRGQQLGLALGARVKPCAELADVQQSDLVVVTKRIPRQTLEAVRASGKPWVFDAIDFYPQPTCSAWDRREAIKWVKDKIDDLDPTAVIWPTARMREDCDAGLPGIVLPHHHRPWIDLNPIREKVRTVGYEGEPKYLAEWLPLLQAECANRGWTFVANPSRLADLDIVVALRGGEWNGYVQRHWKSGVKLANAHASGTPFIGQMEAGYLENATGAEYWARDANELRVALDWLEPQSTRQLVSERFLKAAYSVEQAASDLRMFLIQQFA